LSDIDSDFSEDDEANVNIALLNKVRLLRDTFHRDFEKVTAERGSFANCYCGRQGERLPYGCQPKDHRFDQRTDRQRVQQRCCSITPFAAHFGAEALPELSAHFHNQAEALNYCKNKHMPLNGLAERQFKISLDGQSHKVKAMAVFTVHNVAPEETGLYHLDFTVGGQTVEIVQLDKTFYSRERARRQAEFAFISGDVEAYARRRIKSWIILGY